MIRSGRVHDVEEMMTVSENPAKILSPAAKRMRNSRQRRRDGLRSLRIELRETEIDLFVRKRLLNAEDRGHRNAVLGAFYAFLDRAFAER